MRGQLLPASEDWYEWRQEPPLSAVVMVRVATALGGRMVLRGLRVDGEPTAELLRRIPVGRIEAAANAQLAQPDTAAEEQSADYPRRGRPDLFYKNIAVVYLDLAQHSPRPVAELAASHEVPQTTAHRWVKEARRRGFLPPGRPGAAG